MSAVLSVCLLGVLGLGLRRVGARWAVGGVVVGAGLLWAPMPTLMVGFAASLLLLRRRLGSRRSGEEADDGDVTLLAEMTLLGLNAGLTFPQALESAATHVAEALAHEVRHVLRRASQAGPAAALATREGRAGDLYGIAARAAITGAPIAGGVQSLVDERRATERAASLTAARRLPVRLLFPLALLILPGFMVLTVGPAILSALSRLST